MPYPPTSVRIRAICGRLFSARGSVYSVHSVGASSPLVLLVQFLLWQAAKPSGDSCTPWVGSVGMAGMPYPPTSVRIRAICGRLFSARGSVYSVHSVGASSPLVLLVQFLLWQAAKPSGDSCTPWAGSVGMAGMPYPPTSVNIRVICGSPFSARGSVYSVHSVGASSPLVRLVQLRQLHPLAESTEVVRTSHHLTISPQQHPFTSNPAFCMSSQYCGYDFVTTCGSLMRSPGNTIAAGANAIAMRWSS